MDVTNRNRAQLSDFETDTDTLTIVTGEYLRNNPIIFRMGEQRFAVHLNVQPLAAGVYPMKSLHFILIQLYLRLLDLNIGNEEQCRQFFDDNPNLPMTGYMWGRVLSGDWDAFIHEYL
jgi:hypothetical protein